MQFRIKHSNGGYTELEATDYYCPNCGEKKVAVEKGEGDYYVGPEFYCLKCEVSFNLLGVGPINHLTKLEKIEKQK
jgi:hypothetical protein